MPELTTPRKQKPSIIDALPENYHYADTGCEAAPSCLGCPLPSCKYDDPAGFLKRRRLLRDLRMAQAMDAENLTVAAAANRFGVTERTMFRVLSRCRRAAVEQDAAPLLLAA